jgi:YHS domain-containing protein
MSKINTSGATGVALNGFDPVSFFDGKPANGNFEKTATHKGATYYFVSDENKKKFEAKPDHYAPQYGGFCAFGVSVGAVFPVDMTTAQVYKDKLYINLNSDIVAMFEKDKDGAIAKADKNWPGLSK